MRIPFDALTLAAVVAELQPYVGGRVQGVRQPTETEVAIGLYAGGKEAMLLVSCHPVFARAHFVTRRPANQPQPPVFCATLRARIDGGTLVSAKQIKGDRILTLDFESERGPHRLVVELMGKHSNAMLLDGGGAVVSAAKWVGKSKSSRPIQPGARYELPPVVGGSGQVSSPFLRKLVEAMGTDQPVRAALASGKYQPILSVGNGAYPISVQALGLDEISRSSISIALEQHYDRETVEQEAQALRASLLGQLGRVVLAREAAISDLAQAREAGERAGKLQRWGELILAYGPAAGEGIRELTAWDYDGTEARVPLDPELDFKANAAAYFDRAKRAKARMGQVGEQKERLEADRAAVLNLIERITAEPKLIGLRDLQEEARSRRWLHTQGASAKAKEDRPYEGHRIRELLGPSGFSALYGENAESNDYLTLRVAKPNDYWLHIRGAASAHVVVPTHNHPEKVSREVLMWAAQIAVSHSPSKHAGFVAVDYTLKKYVRKPKGAPKGTALYTHEKTLHVES